MFNADFELQGGLPVPHFVPGETYLENYIATRGATMNIDNQSAFVQDRWAISDRLTANLGLRFEQVKVESTGDITSVNTSPRIVPRLGISFDPTGDGANVIHATYAQYSGRYSEAQVGGNSPVGSPAVISATTPAPSASATSGPARRPTTSPTTRSPRRTSSASKCRWPTSSSMRRPRRR